MDKRTLELQRIEYRIKRKRVALEAAKLELREIERKRSELLKAQAS